MANTGKPANRDSFQSLGKRVQYGLTNGGPMGAIMGFMDMPYRSRQNGMQPMQTMWPGGIDPRMHGSNGGNPQIENPPLPPLDPNDPNDPNNPANTGQFAWKFPQYSQTWAFTPPEPTPYPYPQKFDPAIYGNPLAKKY